MANTEKEAAGYIDSITAFESRYPDIQVNLRFYGDIKYKSSISQWLQTGQFDLLYWQAGRQRLFELAQQGLLDDASEIWQSLNLDNAFPTSIKPLVTHQGKVIAIPFSYYHWGIFYNKALFTKLGIQAPETIGEMLETCDVLTSKRIIPVALSLQQQWPILAWFSYITLRLEGLNFYNQLMDGQVSWQSAKVIRIMRQWQTLFARCGFNIDAQTTSIELSVRTLLKEKTGLLFAGNFIQHHLNDAEIEQLSFFPFPAIDNNMNKIESAPVEVWVMPVDSRNKASARTLLEFFIEAENLASFNRRINYFSPHKTFNDNQPIANKGIALLQQADGLMQYFDRDTASQMVEVAQSIFVEFIEDGNIESALTKLETKRLEMRRQSP